MNKKCLTAELIETYLNSAKGSAIRKELDTHIAKCPACKAIMAAAKLGQPKNLGKAISEVNELLTNKKPVTIKAGQIWRLQYDKTSKKNAVAVVTSIEDKDVSNIVIAYLNPESEFIANGDAVVKADETPIKIDFLAECWDERQVNNDTLQNYMGEVGANAFSRIKKALSANNQKIEAEVEVFRKSQIAKNKGIGISTWVKANADGIIIFCKELFKANKAKANEVLAMAAASFPTEELKKIIQAQTKEYVLSTVKGKSRVAIVRKDGEPFSMTVTISKGKEKHFDSDHNGQIIFEEGFPVDKFESLSFSLNNEK